MNVQWEPIEFDDVEVETTEVAERQHIQVKVILSTTPPVEWSKFFLEAEGFRTIEGIEWRFDNGRRSVTASPRVDPAGLWAEDFAARASDANRRYERDVLGRQ